MTPQSFNVVAREVMPSTTSSLQARGTEKEGNEPQQHESNDRKHGCCSYLGAAAAASAYRAQRGAQHTAEPVVKMTAHSSS